MGFIHRLRVLYGDTDAAGIVYHANYLRFFEAARNEFLRAGGLPYVELERRGLVWPIVETHLRYHRPARYDDLLAIHTRLTEVGAASARLEYEIRDDGSDARLCVGWTRVACTRNGAPTRLPDDVRAALERLVTPAGS